MGEVYRCYNLQQTFEYPYGLTMAPKKPDPLDRQKKYLSSQGSFRIYYDFDAFELRKEAMRKNGVTPKEVLEAGLKGLGIVVKDRYSI